MKICNKCKLEKDSSCFAKRGNSLQSECKDCNKQYRINNKQKIDIYNKSYYIENSEAIIEQNKVYSAKNSVAILQYKHDYYIDNKEYRQNYNSFYYLNNKDSIKKYHKNYSQIRRDTDPSFRLRQIVSTAIYKGLIALGNNKNGNSILEYLPYSIEELKKWLEKQFEPWMNWDNYGKFVSKTWDDNDQLTWKWNIDHIIPQSILPYTSMEDDNFKKCWALENLRPYSAKQNIVDGNRRQSLA